MFCVHCGKQIDSPSRFCPKCGRKDPLASRTGSSPFVCTGCRRPIGYSGDKYCTGCGKPIDDYSRRGANRFYSFHDLVRRPQFAVLLAFAIAAWVVPGGIVSLMYEYHMRSDGLRCAYCWKEGSPYTKNLVLRENGDAGRQMALTTLLCPDHASRAYSDVSLPIPPRLLPLVLAWIVGIGLVCFLVHVLRFFNTARYHQAPGSAPSPKSLLIAAAASILTLSLLFILRPPSLADMNKPPVLTPEQRQVIEKEQQDKERQRREIQELINRSHQK